MFPHSRKNLSLQPVDKEEDAHLFTYRDLNRTHVSVVLAQSVDSLVDSDTPQNVVKFRLGCDFDAGDDLVSCDGREKSLQLVFYRSKIVLSRTI